MQNTNIKNLSTAELLSLREDVIDELTYRLEGHMEQYLGDRSWYEETGDPFSYEEVVGEIVNEGIWDGPGNYEFFACDPHTKANEGGIFDQRAETPEELAELYYEACTAAHAVGYELARAGHNVLCI